MINFLRRLLNLYKENEYIPIAIPVFVDDYSPKRRDYKHGRKYTGNLLVWNEETKTFDYY